MESSCGNRILDLIASLRSLSSDDLAEVEAMVKKLRQPTTGESPGPEPSGPEPSAKGRDRERRRFDWPHSPLHRLESPGTYFVTASTRYKLPLFATSGRLDLIQREFLRLARQYDWQIEAWAIFPNHYHFVGHHHSKADKLSRFLGHLHGCTANEINRQDDQAGRKVWFNYWETRLTYPKSYLARLNYVHQNAVKHGIVRVANRYPWCSAAWFERTASPAQVKTIYSIQTDRIRVHDDYEVDEAPLDGQRPTTV